MAQFQLYICSLLKQATHTPSLSMMPAVALRAQGLLGLSAAFMAKPHLPNCLHSLHSLWRCSEFVFVSVATFCPVAPPLLPSTHFDFWRQTVHYVANMQLWTSSNGNNMWDTRKERKKEFIGTNEHGKDFKWVVTCNERLIKSAHEWMDGWNISSGEMQLFQDVC